MEWKNEWILNHYNVLTENVTPSSIKEVLGNLYYRDAHALHNIKVPLCPQALFYKAVNHNCYIKSQRQQAWWWKEVTLTHDIDLYLAV